MAKLLFITNSLSVGGAEKMLCFIAESLAMRGHGVTIVNRGRSDTDTAYERTFSAPVTVHTLTSQSKWRQIKAIRAIAKKQETDVIIGFTQMPNFMACMAGKSLRIPAVVSERGDPSSTVTASWKDRVVMAAINRAEGGVFQTEGAKAFYGKGLQGRGAVIPNPVFMVGEMPVMPTERAKTVVSMGRLDNRQKRYDIMLQSFALFAQSHPDYTLKLYGEGADKENIMTWAQEMDMAHAVRFMGLSKTPMQDMAGEGMFLITSDYEGISNALLEAMAVGLPCVSTDSPPGGAAMLITSGVSGLLAPVGDIQAIANALCRFADDHILAASCGEAAKEVLTRFEPQKIIDMWEQYLMSLLSASPKGKHQEKK